MTFQGTSPDSGSRGRQGQGQGQGRNKPPPIQTADYSTPTAIHDGVETRRASGTPQSSSIRQGRFSPTSSGANANNSHRNAGNLPPNLPPPSTPASARASPYHGNNNNSNSNNRTPSTKASATHPTPPTETIPTTPTPPPPPPTRTTPPCTSPTTTSSASEAPSPNPKRNSDKYCRSNTVSNPKYAHFKPPCPNVARGIGNFSWNCVRVPRRWNVSSSFWIRWRARTLG
mmetsp:Transcript_25648/g.51825  ORF Transcript_25648/g.51825 Transcript_25648/m.51825 type:complete len:229 (+) Transcript_25648:258-944(+)